jgi:hypothetical protein
MANVNRVRNIFLRNGSILIVPTGNKKPAQGGLFYYWRRGRDYSGYTCPHPSHPGAFNHPDFQHQLPYKQPAKPVAIGRQANVVASQ